MHVRLHVIATGFVNRKRPTVSKQFLSLKSHTAILLNLGEMISRKVPVPEGYMGRIIGKGARGLQSLKEETGAQVSTKKGIRDAVFVQGSEKQVKKAEFEIIRKIVRIYYQSLSKFKVTDDSS